MAVSLVTQIWVARRFGPVGLGEYNATTLYVTAVATLAIAGLPFAVLERLGSLEKQGEPQRREVSEGWFAVCLILGGAAAGVTLVIWGPVAEFGRMEHPTPSPVVAVAVFFAAVQFFVVSVHLARLQMATATLVVIAQPLSVAVGVAASYALPGVSGSALAVLGFFGTGAIAFATLTRARLRPVLRAPQLRTLLRRSLPAFTMLYLTVASSWLDRLIVIAVSGPSGLGLFAASSFLTEAALRIPRSTGTFGITAYARLAGDEAGVARVLDSQIRIGSAFFLAVATLLIAGGAELLVAVAGAGFADGGRTLHLLAVALLPIGLSLALAGNALGTGHFRRLTTALAVLIPLQLALGISLTSVLGPAGMALAAVAQWLVAAAIMLVRQGGERPAVESQTLLILATLAVTLLALSFALAATTLAWEYRTMAAAAAAFAAANLLIRAPERRILRRIAANWRG